MEALLGIFVRWRHQNHRDRKRGLGVQAAVPTTKSLHALAVFAHPSLAFDLVARRDLAQSEPWSITDVPVSYEVIAAWYTGTAAPYRYTRLFP